jgi:hypothetical protein
MQVTAPLVLPVGIRGWMEQEPPKKKIRASRRRGARRTGWRGRKATQRKVSELLVLEAVTTKDLAQRLLAVVFRHYVDGDLVDEGVILPDNVSADDRLLVAHYAVAHLTDLPPGFSRMGIGRRLRILTRTEFLREIFYPVTYDRHGIVVGFDLALSLSRLANDVAPCSDGSFRLHMLGESTIKPRRDGFVRKPEWSSWPGCPDILIAPRGEDALAVSFASQSENAMTHLPGGKSVSAVSWDPRGGQWHGALVQLTQVIDALRGTKHTLGAACRVYGVPFDAAPAADHRFGDDALDRCREVGCATAELWAAIQPDLALHADSNVEAHRVHTAASFARGYWKASGIDRAPKISLRLAAIGAACFTGARVEACVVRHSVPIAVFDRSAAYLRDAVTLGTEELLSAHRLGTKPAKRAFVRFLEEGDLLERTADLAVCHWLGRLFVEVRPHGEPWHVRAWFQDRSAPSLVTAPFFFDGAWWVSAFDVVTAMLYSGSHPEIRQVVELVPWGQRERRPVRLAGGAPVHGELLLGMLRRQIQLERNGSQAGVGLKPMRNSAAFGLLAQMIRLYGTPARHQVWGVDGPRTTVARYELAGELTCLPLAAAITAFGRFQLARVEVKVHAFGGVVAAMDTDSAAFVTTRRGALVPCPGGDQRLPDGTEAIYALSFAQVRRIFGEEAWSNPIGRQSAWGEKYDTLHQETFLFGICNKRTVIYRRGPDGEVFLLHASEILLGGRYLSPTGSEERGPSGARLWVEEDWRYLIDPERHPRPAWWSTSAVRGVALRSPETQARYGAALAVTAFGTLCQAELAPGHHWALSGPVCAYSTDPAAWRHWRDPKTARRTEPITEEELALGKAGDGPIIATLGGVLDRWFAATDPRYEPCSTPEDGCLPVGLLRARPITSLQALAELIGKESTVWGEAFAGDIEPDDPDWLSSFGAIADPWTDVVLPALGRLDPEEIAQHAQRHERQLRDIMAGRADPHPVARQRLIELVYSVALGSLGRKSPIRLGWKTPSERAMFAVIATWLISDLPAARLCEWAGCAEPVKGKQRFHADRCRKAAKRASDRAALAAIGAKRCRYCQAVRYGDTTGPCTECHDRPVVEIVAAVCPDCGAERVGDCSGPCPNCEREKR